MADGFAGAIFDVDGVLVDTPHEAAWRDALRELMEGEWADIVAQTTWSPEAFTPGVYQRELSGKPRDEGALAALQFFGVPDAEARTKAYSDHKQEMVVGLIEAGKFSAYPDALRFLLAVKDAGIKVAAASSSKNAGLFLRQIRLDEFAAKDGLSYDWIEDGLSLLAAFDVDISGPALREGQAAPRDLPRGSRGARRVAGARRSSSKTPYPASRPRRPASSPGSASRATTTRRCSRTSGPTSSSRRWTTSTSPRSARPGSRRSTSAATSATRRGSTTARNRRPLGRLRGDEHQRGICGTLANGASSAARSMSATLCGSRSSCSQVARRTR